MNIMPPNDPIPKASGSILPAERMFEKFSGPRLRTGNTEDGQRQYGSFSLPTEVLGSRLIRVKPLFKRPLNKMVSPFRSAPWGEISAEIKRIA
jgi:hypothetical protein